VAEKTKEKKTWAAISAIAAAISVLIAVGVLEWVKPDVVKRIERGEELVSFGGYAWRVLDKQEGRALLITEDIIELKAYNEEYEDVTWETCTLREHLNGAFYKQFKAWERRLILKTMNGNPDNTWGTMDGERFNTPGGEKTEDHIFLLSVPEILKYFPGLKLHKDSEGDEWWYEADERLVAKFNNSGSWWWLRSPGDLQHDAASVGDDGYVDPGGLNVDFNDAVRPALWLNL